MLCSHERGKFSLRSYEKYLSGQKCNNNSLRMQRALCYFHFCLPSRLASNIFKVIDGWMDDAIFVIFNSISVISGRWLGDNKRLEPRFAVRKISALSGTGTQDTRSIG